MTGALAEVRRATRGASRRAREISAPVLLRWRAEVRNRLSRRPVVDSEGTCDVSLTSFGPRIGSVHLAVESIAAGAVRPRTLTLWLSEDEAQDPLPPPLRRLRVRGLRIAATHDWGAHKKYYPHVSTGDLVRPLVTADDDVFYPRDWLAGLLEAHAETPDAVVAHRAHRFRLEGGRPAPYASWARCTTTTPGPDVFPTGVSGVLYPEAMLQALRDAGDTFIETAPRADDVWLHATALRHGIPVRQTGPRTKLYVAVGGTQRSGLKHSNVEGGGNDGQIRATYSAAELAVLAGTPPQEREDANSS